mmetsp:Transcript_25006/g.30244  ORF Transcript_25006/g.30244 Transcript_25006/m.30244 type:complete len:658 (+) Transcript_25006:420-2393(+)
MGCGASQPVEVVVVGETVVPAVKEIRLEERDDEEVVCRDAYKAVGGKEGTKEAIAAVVVAPDGPNDFKQQCAIKNLEMGTRGAELRGRDDSAKGALLEDLSHALEDSSNLSDSISDSKDSKTHLSIVPGRKTSSYLDDSGKPILIDSPYAPRGESTDLASELRRSQSDSNKESTPFNNDSTSSPHSNSTSTPSSPYVPSSPFSHLRINTGHRQRHSTDCGPSRATPAVASAHMPRKSCDQMTRTARRSLDEHAKVDHDPHKYKARHGHGQSLHTLRGKSRFNPNLIGRAQTFYISKESKVTMTTKKSEFFNFMLQEDDPVHQFKRPTSMVDLAGLEAECARIQEMKERVAADTKEVQEGGDPGQCSPRRFLSKHKLTKKVLGIGGHSHVCSGRVKDTGIEVAVKVLDCRDEMQLHWASTELEVWCDLNHPYIVRLQDYSLAKPVSYFSMELMEGGSLVTYLKREQIAGHEMLEDDIRGCMFRIMMAVYHMHTRSIVHMDIKLDNLILSDKDDIQSVKLADFGSAIYANRDIFEKCHGTPQYMAPEVIKHNMRVEDQEMSGSAAKVSMAADMWSLGVVMFTLLGKYMPFDNTGSTHELYNHILNARSDNFTGSRWKDISPEAQHLIHRMLVVDPNNRITITEALCHPWITRNMLLKDK